MPESLTFNVCCMVDISCFRSSVAIPSLNTSGHQRTIGKSSTLTSFLILHLDQGTIRSRWVIKIRLKEGIVFPCVLFLKIHFSSVLVVLINALYRIYLTKVILQLSLIASEGLFFCSLIIGHVNCIQSNRHRRFAHQCRGSSVPMTLSAFFMRLKTPSFGLIFFVVLPFFKKSFPVYLFQFF